MEHWDAHFRFYDMRQMAHSKYLATLDFHRKALQSQYFVLDSGAGTGNLTIKLLEDGHRVIAADANAYGLQNMKKNGKNYGKRAEKMNVIFWKTTSRSLRLSRYLKKPVFPISIFPQLIHMTNMLFF